MIVLFGECMIELAGQDHAAIQLGYAGDTLNTAVYLARLGQRTAFLTALGHDHYSAAMADWWQKEGLDPSFVLTHSTRVPGLYAIATDQEGERSFTYWRDSAAVREMFRCDGFESVRQKAEAADLFYFSGISLAILSPEDRQVLFDMAANVRANGGKVAFDPNYRARLWDGPEAFRAELTKFAPLFDIVLPGREEEAAIWGDRDAEASLARWVSLGAAEVVVKDGAKGALTADGQVPPTNIVKPLDTTGAGDSFNAGYLAARANGQSVLEAAKAGGDLAATVVQYAGAIIDKAKMPK